MYLDSGPDPGESFIWAQFDLIQLSELGKARDFQITWSCVRDEDIEAQKVTEVERETFRAGTKSPRQSSMRFPTLVPPNCPLQTAVQLAASQPPGRHDNDARDLGCYPKPVFFIFPSDAQTDLRTATHHAMCTEPESWKLQA